MNLFASTETSAADPVRSALRKASSATGTNFDYLLDTARRESSLDPNAAATASSASGLFQFVEQTWLRMVKEAGPSLGLGDYANAITKSGGGRYATADGETRRSILALRNDPEASALIAGAFTQENRGHLADALRREPSTGELYAAHFLGAQGAVKLVSLAETAPGTSAAEAFPAQAAANRAMFYAPTGEARTVGDLYTKLTTASGPAATGGAEDKLPQNPAAWLAIPAHNAYAAEAGMPLYSLFRSDPSAPVSNAVETHWSGLAKRTERAETAALPAEPPAPASRPAPAITTTSTTVEMTETPDVSTRIVTAVEAPPEAGGTFGFFRTLFAQSQAAPVRTGKAWGG